MRRGRNIVVGLIGGTAMVALCYGVFLLGEHAPEWLGPAVMLAAFFAVGAFAAIEIDKAR